MRITGIKDVFFGTGLYYILATLFSAKSIIIRRIAFMVDTGCQITTISVKDSASFYADIPEPSTWTLGASGRIATSVLTDCGVLFDLVQSAHIEKLDKIHVLHPDLETPPDVFNNLMGNPSTLGMNILSRYYLNFDSTTVTLEK